MPEKTNEKNKIFFESIANKSWALDQVPNFRDRDIPCLKCQLSHVNAFIYMNQMTKKFCVYAKCVTLSKKNQGCIPTTSHDMVIGSCANVKKYVKRYADIVSITPDALNALDAMFDEFKQDMAS